MQGTGAVIVHPDAPGEQETAAQVQQVLRLRWGARAGVTARPAPADRARGHRRGIASAAASPAATTAVLTAKATW